MLLQLENKILAFINSNGLIAPAQAVLLAVSGGADSSALLHILCALRQNGFLDCRLICAHINHQLRGPESDADQQFVRRQAESLGLEIITKAVDVRGFAAANALSIETAARQLRLQTLIALAREKNCAKIATAHQKDDNAETLVHRLLRGTGFRGLAGIWPAGTLDAIPFIRPMLCASRKEIIDYLQQRKMPWRTDRTNFDCAYKRNFIRHKLLPHLERDFTGPLADRLSELSIAARSLCKLVDGTVEPILAGATTDAAGNLSLALEELAGLSAIAKVELFRRCLVSIDCPLRNISTPHYKQMLQMTDSGKSSRRLSLPADYSIQRCYSQLLFCPPSAPRHPSGTLPKPTQINLPGQTRIGNLLVEAEIISPAGLDLDNFKADKTPFEELFDADKLSPPIFIRPRQTADRFIPFGMASPKKVGKFLTAEKVPQYLRDNILIVADTQKIIWLWPIRLCNQTRITAKTGSILKLRIIDTGML